MLTQLKNSFAFRSGPIYQKLCSVLPNPKYKAGSTSSFRLLSMTGARHIDMLNQCLISLHNTWTQRPELIIYSDGTISTQALQKKLNWWKGKIKLGTNEDILNWTKNFGCTALHTFALKEAVGRKLACILSESTEAPVLWCDTDILWYKQLDGFINSASIQLKVSEDYQSAYDGYISQKCPEILQDPPFVNTGLVYLQGSLLSREDLAVWINQVGDKPNHFTEQTFLAIAAKLLSADMWRLNEIACFQSDRFELSPSYLGKDWIARHYVGPVRHLFWRDAFYKRFAARNE